MPWLRDRMPSGVPSREPKLVPAPRFPGAARQARCPYRHSPRLLSHALCPRGVSARPARPPLRRRPTGRRPTTTTYARAPPAARRPSAGWSGACSSRSRRSDPGLHGGRPWRSPDGRPTKRSQPRREQKRLPHTASRARVAGGRQQPDVAAWNPRPVPNTGGTQRVQGADQGIHGRDTEARQPTYAVTARVSSERRSV